MPTLVSLFSDIGGFDLGFEAAGFKTLAQVEIDDDCQELLASKFPKSVRHADILDFDPSKVERPDVIAFGSPCQDLSVAGQRAGLSGERSGLFHQAIRVCKALRPRFIVFENVPGLLTSCDGRDIQTVLDAFNDAGYLVDIGECDAQYFGLAQRRNRIFTICESVSHGLKARSDLFSRTLAECVIQTLREALSEHIAQSDQRPTGSDSSSVGSGLMRRIRFFSNWSLMKVWNASPVALAGILRKPPNGCISWESLSMEGPNEYSSQTQEISSILKAIGCAGSQIKKASVFPSLSMLTSWRKLLEESSFEKNSSTTSTVCPRTTDQTIFMCAEIVLTTCASIAASRMSFPSWWPVALLCLTALREFTNYAERKSEDLFTGSEVRRKFGDFHRKANEVCLSLANSGADRLQEVLSLAESVCGDTAPSREKGQGTSPTLEGRAGRSGETNFATSGGLIGPCAKPISAHHSRQDLDNDTYVMAHGQANAEIRSDGEPSLTCNHEAPILAHTLRAKADASEDGTGRGTPLVVAFSSKDSGLDATQDLSPTMRAQTGPGAVAFTQNQREEVRELDIAGSQSSIRRGDAKNETLIAFKPNQGSKSRSLGAHEELSPALEGAAGGNNKPAFSAGSTVRRLTPLECERLQGFPDGWTGDGFSDSVRYRMLGNAVAVPVAHWIAKRLMEVLRVTPPQNLLQKNAQP